MDLKKIFQKSVASCPHCRARFEIGPDIKSIADFVFNDLLSSNDLAGTIDRLIAEIGREFEIAERGEIEDLLAQALQDRRVIRAIFSVIRRFY